MFILDDLLLAPARGLLALGREVQRQSDQADQTRVQSLTDQLTTLYMQLETGQITQADFAHDEEELVRQIEAAGNQLQTKRPRRSRPPATAALSSHASDAAAEE